MPGQCFLAADIGGTRARLLLGETRENDNGWQPIARWETLCGDHASIEDLLQTFLKTQTVGSIDVAVLAVAAPVDMNAPFQKVTLTNLAWQVDIQKLTQLLAITEVHLLNDFAAIAQGLDDLPPDSLFWLQTGTPNNQAPRLVVGAGTGLGACLRLSGPTPQVLATEAGHAGFAPSNALQQSLWQFIHAQQGRCTREDLLSGRGIARIAAFFCGQPDMTSPALEKALEETDPAAQIAALALEQEDPLALRVLQQFIEMYGSQVGDLALDCLPFGGVYIAGGIAAKLRPLLTTSGFIEAFTHKPPMQHLLQRMPVGIIQETDAGLLGAARYARERLRA
ncbi:glucokinase [Ectothiorhodosinus mongolicus]|uniref:Glucokinase n=1 Tax=Ectothiorhodosinus mongolicus TaxID=233100 RepID=A0A1R3W0Y3_9GAMM|nr:glucokinase [Ectothiorhodosinus mongolicus]ULX57341.1 glucokinase [Ectothiorhodosinus mongolicus]SIT71050.1 glucokinase [Ectothiorhodosinus mongolicus]